MCGIHQILFVLITIVIVSSWSLPAIVIVKLSPFGFVKALVWWWSIPPCCISFSLVIRIVKSILFLIVWLGSVCALPLLGFFSFVLWDSSLLVFGIPFVKILIVILWVWRWCSTLLTILMATTAWIEAPTSLYLICAVSSVLTAAVSWVLEPSIAIIDVPAPLIAVSSSPWPRIGAPPPTVCWMRKSSIVFVSTVLHTWVVSVRTSRVWSILPVARSIWVLAWRILLSHSIVLISRTALGSIILLLVILLPSLPFLRRFSFKSLVIIFFVPLHRLISESSHCAGYRGWTSEANIATVFLELLALLG